MANSILTAMQEIEDAAAAVLAGYEAQLAEQRAQVAEALDALALAEDKATADQVQGLEEASQQHLSKLKAQARVTIDKNDARLRSALTDKKDELAQQIVDKVVEKYGN